MLPPKLDQIVHRLIVELHGSPLTRNEVAAAGRSITAGLEQIADEVKVERPGIGESELVADVLEKFVAGLARSFAGRPFRRDAILAATCRVIVDQRLPEISEAQQAALLDRLRQRASHRLAG
jgi:hypothetical protein